MGYTGAETQFKLKGCVSLETCEVTAGSRDASSCPKHASPHCHPAVLGLSRLTI